MQADSYFSFDVATHTCASVREFVKHTFEYAGFRPVEFRGEGLKEVLYWTRQQEDIPLVIIDKQFFRPGEVPYLLGDPT